MAYSDFLHCYDCGAKVISWGNWDWRGCAHCAGDNERALDGVVAVYCTDCTTAKGLVKPPDHPVAKALIPEGTHWAKSHWGSAITRANLHNVEVRYDNDEPASMLITVGSRRRGVRIPHHTWEWLRFELLLAIQQRAATKEAA